MCRFSLIPLFIPIALAAQLPAYTPAQLDGARFRQTIRSQIRIETGSAVTQERSGRDGVIVIAAVDGDSGIELTGWFDSLAVWREAGGQRFAPETDGMVGGRYHGRLSSNGVYTWDDQPFIPDEVSEIAELGSAFDDVLPPLPRTVLRPGQVALLDGGWRIERRADSTAAGQTVRRYFLSGDRRRTAVGAALDSLPVEAATTEKETGSMVWSPRFGPLLWQRQITLTATLPAKGSIKRAVRTSIEQTVTLERMVAGAEIVPPR
ncbi:MAG: hypothetical protein ABJC74_07950 [Gemmatimonadota bacterium]